MMRVKCLGAADSALAGDYRQEGGQNHYAGQSGLEQRNGECGEEGGGEVDGEPRQSGAYGTQ